MDFAFLGTSSLKRKRKDSVQNGVYVPVAISFWNGLVPLRRIFKRWQEPFCLCPGSVLCLA